MPCVRSRDSSTFKWVKDQCLSATPNLFDNIYTFLSRSFVFGSFYAMSETIIGCLRKRSIPHLKVKGLNGSNSPKKEEGCGFSTEILNKYQAPPLPNLALITMQWSRRERVTEDLWALKQRLAGHLGGRRYTSWQPAHSVFKHWKKRIGALRVKTKLLNVFLVANVWLMVLK